MMFLAYGVSAFTWQLTLYFTYKLGLEVGKHKTMVRNSFAFTLLFLFTPCEAWGMGLLQFLTADCEQDCTVSG